MKCVIVALICMLINMSLADQPRDMSNRELGVWKLASADQKQILEQSVETQEGISVPSWKVVDKESGKLLWSGRPKLGFVPRKNEVFLASGGKNVGVTNRYLFFKGRQEDVGEQKVLWIFHQAELKQDYAIKEFGMSDVEIKRTKRTVSHIHLFPDGFDFVTQDFLSHQDYNSNNATKTKLFGGDSTSLILTFRCGLQVTVAFDKKVILDSRRIVSESDFLTIGDIWFNF